MNNKFVDGKCIRKVNNKEVVTISITAGIAEDLETVIFYAFHEFEKEGGPRFSVFTKVYKCQQFGCIFNGRESYRDLYEFTEELFHAVKIYVAPTMQNNKPNNTLMRYAGLYMMYALYFKQPCRPRVKLRMTLEEVTSLVALVEQARSDCHWDVVYAWSKLFTSHAFHYTAMPTQMGIEMAIQLEQKKKSENLSSRGVQSEYFTSREFSGQMKNLRKSHSKYTRMKLALANPTDPIEKSLFFIDKNLLENINQSIHPKETPEVKLHKDTEGIGLKRRELKNKFFSAGGFSEDSRSEVSD